MKRVLIAALGVLALSACNTAALPALTRAPARPARRKTTPTTSPKPKPIPRTTTTTTVAPIPVLPPGVILVGDSVTNMANLDNVFVGAQVDAVNGRSMVNNHLSDNGLDAIARLRAQGYNGRWIIALGLNDLQYETSDVTALTSNVRRVVAATGSTDVEWVIPYVDADYVDVNGIAPRAVLAAHVPALLAAVEAAGITNLIRWDEAGVPADVYDGAHPTAQGAVDYAALINAAIAVP
jgi:Prokaryotic membrane lipoprotein lipid attachment site